MFNSSILDVAIGMVFIYVLISLLCSAIKEMISQVLKLRAKNLEAGLVNLLQSGEGNQLAAKIYSHPLINGLSKPGMKPSYIPPKNFTLALMDVMSGNTGKPPTDNKSLLHSLEAGHFANAEAGKAVILLLNAAGNDANKARESIENWYNDAMDRVGGWYKKTSQTIIFVIALVICFSLNIDSIKISQTLWTDTALRQVIVETASSQNVKDLVSQQTPVNGQSTDTVTTDDLKKSAEHSAALLEQIKDLKLPIGWQEEAFAEINWFIKIMGLLISSLAASLGAPFWFQLLNKVVDLRSAGKQPAKMSTPTPTKAE
jgi:hypothetical protein